MIWVDLTEEELLALTLRGQPVPESVRQKALQMTHERFLERLHANAAKPVYRKHTRRARPVVGAAGGCDVRTDSVSPPTKGVSVPGGHRARRADESHDQERI